MAGPRTSGAGAGAARGGLQRQATMGSGAALSGKPASAKEPYYLRAVAHSLGGMSMLIHMVSAGRRGRPSHVHRLILLTPAGYHVKMPLVSSPTVSLPD